MSDLCVAGVENDFVDPADLRTDSDFIGCLESRPEAAKVHSFTADAEIKVPSAENPELSEGVSF